MISLRLKVPTSTLCILVLALNAYPAQTVVFQQGLNGYSGTDDNTIYEDRTQNSNGGHHLFHVGNSISDSRRGLIRFDLNSSPNGILSGSIILNVELQLVVQYSGLEASDDDVYSLHRLQNDWGEGSVDSGDPGGLGTPANVGDATWTDNHFMESQWTTAGGDFLTTPSVQLPIARWNPVDAGKNIYTFSSPGLVEDVQEWIKTPEENFGWILIGQEGGSRNARRFYSSEDPGEFRPRLTVTFEPPTNAETIARYLLGVYPNPAGLDLNDDGVVDVADAIRAADVAIGLP